MERIELTILENDSFNKFKKLLDNYNLVNVYLGVDITTISKVREDLVNLGYTTRLFVVLDGNTKKEYIYGKKKGSKGVFNEKCKNSLIRENIVKVVDVSSNEYSKVVTDIKELENLAKNKNYLNREWIII